MRAFAFRCRFGLICVPFRSLQHLLTTADHLATLRRCAEHLQPGGRLAFSLSNPQPLRRHGGHRPPRLRCTVGIQRHRSVTGSWTKCAACCEPPVWRLNASSAAFCANR